MMFVTGLPVFFADLCSVKFIFIKKRSFMVWYQYIAVFFAGAFWCNAVPHFVQGVCGNGFPSPFAKPPGKGLSSPVVNVLWGVFNMIIGFLLYTVAPIDRAHPVNLVVFFAGITTMGLMIGNHFKGKDKE